MNNKNSTNLTSGLFLRVRSSSLGLFHPIALRVICIVLVAGLTACTSSKRMTRVDDSVEYKSARALPPLKYERNQAVSVAPSGNTASADNGVVSIGGGAVNVQAELIASTRGYKRLQLMSVGREAWNYTRQKAKESGLSIFSRDFASGRIYIGCGDIDSVAKPAKKSGWTVFKRDEQSAAADHCSLKLNEEGGKTVVRVLNKAGVEVVAEQAEPILLGLLH